MQNSCRRPVRIACGSDRAGETCTDTSNAQFTLLTVYEIAASSCTLEVNLTTMVGMDMHQERTISLDRNGGDSAPPRETNLASSLTSAKSLIALQLLSRLITFSLNQALIRIASPKVFGTAAVQFDLVRDTILFLSREGVRAVVVRIPGEKKVESGRGREWIEDARIHNLVNLPFAFALVVAGGLLPLYLQSLPSTTTSQPFFHSALGLYIAATLVELLTEPFYLLAQLSSPVNTGLRVQAEGTAIILRAVVTVGCLVGANEQYALLAFAIGQLAYSLALGIRYSYAYWWHTALWRIPFRRAK